MAFSPSNISNNILWRSFDSGVAVSPMKLQKLLYFVASEYAKETGQPLLAEPFRAWRYGPVVRSVYDEFKSFRGDPIRKYAKDAQGKAYRISEKDNPELRDALDRVWSHAASMSAVELSRITHAPDSAWSKAWNHHELISDEDLAQDRTYLKRLGLKSKKRS